MAENKNLDYGNVDFEAFLQLLNNSRSSNLNCTPLPDDFFSKYVPHAHGRQIAVSAAYGCICAAGLIANAVVLFLLLAGGRKGATFKAPSTILIMNLAIADMLFMVTLPFSISQRLNKGWRFGTAMCKFEEGVKFLNYYGSVFFITAMAIDRYLVITHPAILNRKVARRYMCIASLILWGMALIAVLPLFIFAGVDAHGFCSIMFPSNTEIVVHNKTSALQALAGEECLETYLYYGEYDEYYDGGKSTLMADGASGDVDPTYVAGSGSVSDYEEYFDLTRAVPTDHQFECKHPDVRSLHIWLIWNFIIGFVLPFFIISCCYIKIMNLRLPLISTQQRQHAVSDSANNNEIRYNGNGIATLDYRDDANKLIWNSDVHARSACSKQRAKILMNILVPCLIISFAICWLPYHAYHLSQIRGIIMDSSNTCHAIRDVTFCLAFFNSALNPILNSFFLFNIKQRLHRSSTWVSGQLKNLSLKRKTNKDGETVTKLNGNHEYDYDGTNADEMTMVTTAAGIDE